MGAGVPERWSAIRKLSAGVAGEGYKALLPISCDQEEYHANLVALPVEREEEFLNLLGQK